jgi:branched-subunit amino acid transport protein
MDPTLKLWTLIVVVGALNYLSRLSFIAFFARREMPPLLARALKFVPAAMLTALVVPMVMQPSLVPTDAVGPRVAAALVAGAIAWRWRSEIATIGAGMAALWALKALL